MLEDSKDKVRELIIQSYIAKNCSDAINDSDNKTEAWSKAAVIMSTKDDYNDDKGTKSYNEK